MYALWQCSKLSYNITADFSHMCIALASEIQQIFSKGLEFSRLYGNFLSLCLSNLTCFELMLMKRFLFLLNALYLRAQKRLSIFQETLRYIIFQDVVTRCWHYMCMSRFHNGCFENEFSGDCSLLRLRLKDSELTLMLSPTRSAPRGPRRTSRTRSRRSPRAGRSRRRRRSPPAVRPRRARAASLWRSSTK